MAALCRSAAGSCPLQVECPARAALRLASRPDLCRIRRPQSQLEVRIRSSAVREKHEGPADMLHAEFMPFESCSDELYGQEALVRVDDYKVPSGVRTALRLRIPRI